MIGIVALISTGGTIAFWVWLIACTMGGINEYVQNKKLKKEGINKTIDELPDSEEDSQ